MTNNIDQMSSTDRAKLETLLTEIKRRRHREECQKDFLTFVKHMWGEEFIFGRHHARIAHEFEAIEAGGDGRLIINLGPRHSKSKFTSIYLPAWYLGKHPKHKIIQCSVTAELAVGFGREVRNLIDTEAYREIFPGVSLRADSKAAGRWATNQGGEYFAIGVSGNVSGLGASILIIDDPHSEQDAIQAMTTPAVYDKTFEWYKAGPRQRLQPQGSIVVCATRWSKRDLTGQLLQEAANGGEQWKHISFPAILPSGQPLWPEFWTLKALLATKAAISIQKWQAQYMQLPTSDLGAIIKRSDWMRWEEDEPPEVDFILQTVDTAYEKTQRADYSVIATWGIFYHDADDTGQPQANIILLNVLREKCEFPRLKIMIAEEWREYKADCLLIEKKASGAPLIYELRTAGIPCSEFTPNRATGDKICRLNSVTDAYASHRVWAPRRQFAEELIEEVASFPNGDHDDQVDVTSMAIAYFRQGGFIRNSADLEDDIQYFRSHKRSAYY